MKNTFVQVIRTSDRRSSKTDYQQNAPCSSENSCATWGHRWLERRVYCWRSQHFQYCTRSHQCHHPAVNIINHTL